MELLDAAVTTCPNRERASKQTATFCACCGVNLQTGSLPTTVTLPEGFADKVEEQVNDLKQIGWLFGLLLSSSVVFGLASGLGDSLRSELLASTVDAIIIMVFVVRHRSAVFPLLSYPKFGWLEVGKLVVSSLLFVLAMGTFFSSIRSLGVPWIQATSNYVNHGWSLFAMLIPVSLAPAVFEELAFRGVIQSNLEKLLSERDAWIIQAALFSVLHLSPLIFPSHFFMGLFLGWLRRRTKSLYPGMVLHATWNGIVVLAELGGR
jgi:membrane protease YdiL (CAAX protease family)